MGPHSLYRVIALVGLTLLSASTGWPGGDLDDEEQTAEIAHGYVGLARLDVEHGTLAEITALRSFYPLVPAITPESQYRQEQGELARGIRVTVPGTLIAAWSALRR